MPKCRNTELVSPKLHILYWHNRSSIRNQKRGYRFRLFGLLLWRAAGEDMRPGVSLSGPTLLCVQINRFFF